MSSNSNEKSIDVDCEDGDSDTSRSKPIDSILDSIVEVFPSVLKHREFSEKEMAKVWIHFSI